MNKDHSEGLSIFERYLFIWVAVCMGAGLLLSKFVPSIGETINSWQIRGISIPIGVCLFLMMYPALLNLQASELKKLPRNPKPILLTLLSNWIVTPLIALLLANIFLKGNEQLTVAFILLGASPCTAMVLVWGKLANGNQEQNVVNTSLNTITVMFLYVPVVALLTGIQNIPIDRWQLVVSALVFIGLPLVLGIFSKWLIIRTKGEDWFHNVYRPIVGRIAILALLMTLVVLFSLNGKVLLGNFDLLGVITIPLLIHFVIIVGFNLLMTRIFGLAYREAIITVLIGSSSHFEIAIASAVAIYGVGSVAALGTTMGLFWEVPIMLSLVAFGKYLNRKHYWKQASGDSGAGKSLRKRPVKEV
jgi:ACR3 family arsenite transporter